MQAASRQPDRSGARVLVAEDQLHVREALRAHCGGRLQDDATLMVISVG